MPTPPLTGRASLFLLWTAISETHQREERETKEEEEKVLRDLLITPILLFSPYSFLIQPRWKIHHLKHHKDVPLAEPKRRWGEDSDKFVVSQPSTVRPVPSPFSFPSIGSSSDFPFSFPSPPVIKLDDLIMMWGRNRGEKKEKKRFLNPANLWRKRKGAFAQAHLG